MQLIASHLSYHYICLHPGPVPLWVGCIHFQTLHSNKNVLEFTNVFTSAPIGSLVSDIGLAEVTGECETAFRAIGPIARCLWKLVCNSCCSLEWPDFSPISKFACSEIVCLGWISSLHGRVPRLPLQFFQMTRLFF